MSERKEAILLAGAQLASKHGSDNVTRKMVADACGVTPGLVGYYMGSVEDSRKAWAARARKEKLPLPSKAESIKMGTALRKKGK